jgi:glycosyltransferase involved in cell wall biosynthesis
MRATEADRDWKIDQAEMKHPFYIDKGFYRSRGRFHFHFNPLLIAKILKAKPADIIIGGAWNDIDVVLLVVLKRLGVLRSRLHFWSEANYLTIGARNDNIFKHLVRSFVFNTADGSQIRSGKMTEMTFEKWKIPVKHYVDLPNTIEEDKFEISDEEIELRYRNQSSVFVLPTRLDERIKGIINFFKSIGDENIRRGLFLVAGDGPDKEAMQQFIAAHKLESNIKLLGFCRTEKMVEFYKQANVFVLPSFSDASPLSLIEALKMKLPLLVSDRCGNHFEAVVSGSNGYLFDPAEADSVKNAFESLISRADDWRQMGEFSGHRYRQVFSKSLVIERFMADLMRFAN